MNSNPDSSRKNEELSWLEQLQRNSWEPEVIISGIILAFLFAFPSRVYEFAAFLIQEAGVNSMLSWLILIYLTAIISVFKIFFVVHLALRFMWAGLLGLSYAFPKGVIQERLFKTGQGYDYQQPDSMVLRLERICSSTFAFPVSLSIIFLIITLYLGILVAVYLWLDFTFIQIYLFFMITLLVFALLMMTKKKTKFKSWYSTSIVSSISAIYQSNIGKWYSIGYILLIFILAAPIIVTDVRDFTLFFNERNMLDHEVEWPAKNLYFESDHNAGKRFPRAFLANEAVEGQHLRLGIARYEGDQKMMEIIKREFSSSLDSLGWHELNQTADLHRIYVNDSLISVNGWAKYRLAGAGQRVYQSLLDVSFLAPGRYQIRVEKLMLRDPLFGSDTDLRVLENWSVFEFIKL
ncbi:hypothetical protein [uncultured Algoriphagus sp.]|uniref:hypothetical protein n=1 Tax=uncultured Algoriphagus sp. TaxID=417365 RepID=UPI002599B60B|nr:hypothetical protein [uncultured Algoriphagus sp.]